MAKWYECKVKYPKPGQPGKVTETYLVDALSFTEAEAKIIHEITPYSTGGDVAVTGIKPSKISEVFFTSAAMMALHKSNSDIEMAIIKRDGKKLDEATSLDTILNNDDPGKWYLCKVVFTTVNEKTGAEKRQAPTSILVQAQDLSAARERFNEGMKGTVADWDLVNIGETPIVDVFKYVAKETTPRNQQQITPQHP